MNDLLSNNTEIKIILSQQNNVEDTVNNTFAQKHVEKIKLHFNQQIAGVKFYMKNSLNELSARESMLMREYSNINSTKTFMKS